MKPEHFRVLLGATAAALLVSACVLCMRGEGVEPKPERSANAAARPPAAHREPRAARLPAASWTAVSGAQDEEAAVEAGGSAQSMTVQPTAFEDGLVVFRLAGGPSEFTDETRGDVFGVLSSGPTRPSVREVSGHVIDEDGRPASGAAVVVSTMPAILPGPLSGVGEFGGRAAAMADADGRFVVRVPATRQTVVATLSGQGWSEPVALPTGETDVAGVELTLAGAARLSGSVLVDGAAAEGVVSVLRADGGTKVLGRARLDAEGRYSGEHVEHDFEFDVGCRVEVRSTAADRVTYYLLEAATETHSVLRDAISDPATTVLIAQPTPDDEERFAVFEGVEFEAFSVCAMSGTGLDGEAPRVRCERRDAAKPTETYTVQFDTI